MILFPLNIAIVNSSQEQWKYVAFNKTLSRK